METVEFKKQLHEYSQWRDRLTQSIEMYHEWRKRYSMDDNASSDVILNTLNSLKTDQITLAFVGEFSRGKTELINSLFFSETGVRLLPSTPGRTTMCPSELFYDAEGGSYIKLLSIETRLEDVSLAEYKNKPDSWIQMDLDCNSPSQMQQAFKELNASKRVSVEIADKLGLYDEELVKDQGIENPTEVEVPVWRHALISFPHPLLQGGLSILDTPGLNALGTEPELTLRMLPSAHAIIFVLAADTGVTKSDLDMWNNHVCASRGQNKNGLAVVMNKVDTLWDDLAGEEGMEEAIKKQVTSCASILGVEENVIFPLAAKQALLAKIKTDKSLLKRSRLDVLESYLANDLLSQRQDILVTSLNRNIGHMVKESIMLTEEKASNAAKQLEEFRKIDFENQEITGKLMAETRDRQNAYLNSVENFKASQRVLTVQTHMLIDSVSKDKIDTIVKRTRGDMAKSLTTFGMKQNIRDLFDELRDLLQDTVDITNETKRLVKAIHKKFEDEHGFKEIEPQLFSIKPYQLELERIFEEGEAFRNSAKTTMTEQSVVVNKLYGTLILQARKILGQAHKDAMTWSNSVLVPLMHQIKDHKKQIENRLVMLRKINGSKEEVASSMESLESELSPLIKQRNELFTIKKGMFLDDLKQDETEGAQAETQEQASSFA